MISQSRPGVLFLLLLGLGLVASCFGTDRRGGVVQYAGGLAITGLGRFEIGKLPPPWKGPRLELKQLVYKNNEIGGTIVTDARCGPKFDDAPVSRLAYDLFERLDNKSIGGMKKMTLDGRAGVRVSGSGSLDGVLLKMDVVVVKKDFCLYDFVYFAPPRSFSNGIKDFEGYLNGFKTQ